MGKGPITHFLPLCPTQIRPAATQVPLPLAPGVFGTQRPQGFGWDSSRLHSLSASPWRERVVRGRAISRSMNINKLIEIAWGVGSGGVGWGGDLV